MSRAVANRVETEDGEDHPFGLSPFVAIASLFWDGGTEFDLIGKIGRSCSPY